MTSDLSRRRFLGAVTILSAAPALAKDSGLRIGCQANGFPPKQGDYPGLLTVLPQMKELGYTGFECNTRFVEAQFDRAAEARRELAKDGLVFIGAHYSMQQVKPDTFSKVAAGVAALGAQAIVMSGKALSTDGNFSSDDAKKKAADMNALGRICREHGIRMAYHNHNNEFKNGNAEVNALADATDSKLVDFLMDAGHGYLGGGNPAEFMRNHAKRIYGCHVKTFRGPEASAKQVPLGKGDFGFEALAAAIKNTGWSGCLIDEEGGGPKGGDTAAVGPDREYFRRIFGA